MSRTAAASIMLRIMNRLMALSCSQDFTNIHVNQSLMAVGVENKPLERSESSWSSGQTWYGRVRACYGRYYDVSESTDRGG